MKLNGQLIGKQMTVPFTVHILSIDSVKVENKRNGQTQHLGPKEELFAKTDFYEILKSYQTL